MLRQPRREYPACPLFPLGTVAVQMRAMSEYVRQWHVGSPAADIMFSDKAQMPKDCSEVILHGPSCRGSQSDL